MPEREKPQRGLPAITRARELREARKNNPAASGKFWIWSGVAVAALSIFYWKKTQADNEAYRTRVLTRQRAIAAEMGPLFFPLREKIERWTADTARGEWANELVGGSAEVARVLPELLKKPGIYLRLAQPDAQPAEKLRVAATDSLLDEFVLRFVRNPGPDPHLGKECTATRECTPGQMCNEIGHCAEPSQPYNLRIAYRGTRVLNDEWVHTVETADEELRLRLFERDLNSAVESDIPITIDLLKRAQYFLVVIDELPPGLVAADKDTSLEQTAQAEVHTARVAVYDIRRDALVARVRERVDATVPVVQNGIGAQRRQIFNYELARQSRSDMGIE